MRYLLKTRRSWKRFGNGSFFLFGLVVAATGLIDVFFPGDLAKQTVLFWVSLAGCLVLGLWWAIPKAPSTSYSSPRTTIRLVEGDLFSQGEDTHLVIGVCDTFDTAAPHIASASIQGQFLQRVYGNDLESLDRDIVTELSGHAHERTIPDKSGKVLAYPLGTTITLRSGGRRFFLVAYTRMDHRSSASATTDGVWNSLSNLWEEVRNECNGGTVCIPLIGGGQSKLSRVLPDIDSVRFIVLSYMLAARHKPICGELRMVVPHEQYSRLDLFEVQAFLDSLRRS
jgi:Domain of unknown function (DUF6430)